MPPDMFLKKLVELTTCTTSSSFRTLLIPAVPQANFSVVNGYNVCNFRSWGVHAENIETLYFVLTGAELLITYSEFSVAKLDTTTEENAKRPLKPSNTCHSTSLLVIQKVFCDDWMTQQWGDDSALPRQEGQCLIHRWPKVVQRSKFELKLSFCDVIDETAIRHWLYLVTPATQDANWILLQEKENEWAFAVSNGFEEPNICTKGDGRGEKHSVPEIELSTFSLAFFSAIKQPFWFFEYHSDPYKGLHDLYEPMVSNKRKNGSLGWEDPWPPLR